ncbi:PilN domain-containing protein [Vibrio maritimus]|uniref:PilN domain-containing protein n=1 Tax=Vibrio maritimus TaxID=990268 RepID=UPI001F1B34A9|nr:PilN domain-containing protein [Vibrio maritimus]
MALINLLPWREEQRNQRRQGLMLMLITATFVGYVSAYFAMVKTEGEVSAQRDRVDYLQTAIQGYRDEIKALSTATKELETLEARLDYVEKLQRQRHQTIAVMNLLPTLIPEQVYVDKVRMEGVSFKLSGIGESTAVLAQMLDRFEQSKVINSVEMHSIVHNRERFGNKFQSFQLSFHLDSEALLLSVSKERVSKEQQRLDGEH